MRIKIMNRGTRHSGSLRITNLVFLMAFVFWAGVAYAEENLEQLKQDLLAQEKQAAMAQQQPAVPKAIPVVQEKNVTSAKKQAKVSARTNKSNVSPLKAESTDKTRPVKIKSIAQTQIGQLYQDAEALYHDGKFDEAKAKLEEILKLNPIYVPAQRFIKLIVDRQNEIAFKDNVITSKERMTEVDKAWLPPAKKEISEADAEVKQREKTPQQKMMEEKANQVIPEINFTDAHIRDVLKYLSDMSGINIVIDEDIFPKMSKPEIMPAEVEVNKTDVAEAALPEQRGIVSDRITISLTNIPLIEALKYILYAKGLKYRIDEYAIVVSTPERLAAVEMDTRYYNLSAGVGIFTEFAKRVEQESKQDEKKGTTRGLKTESKITIKDVLEQSGVPFPPGSKVFLDKRTGTLIVRNTPQNLALVDEVLRMLDITPFQVEIEARFIELTQETAQELGVEWMITSPDFRFGNDDKFRWDNTTTDPIYGAYPDPFGTNGKQGITKGLRYLDQPFLTDAPYKTQPSGNILSISGVLSQPEFRAILHALDQGGFSNVLSAPKVTTLNNQQAQIQVVKEIIYPTEFELTPATTNDTGTIVTQPVVTPSSWTTRDVGILLNVTPSVGADKKTINLNLKPEVSKLEKWMDYGIKGGATWNDIPILQPIFFTKNVETSVIINNGETVVLGGLIKEEVTTTEDKIPLLGDIPFVGRLFRSNTEKSSKTNLLIFVTANLLTPAGERIRK